MAAWLKDALKQIDLEVPTLGPCTFDSPLRPAGESGRGLSEFVSEKARVLFSAERRSGRFDGDVSFEKAGPRQKIFFDPRAARAAILTAGGLSPGVNSVVRSLVLELHHIYGVRDILGFRFGYEGLNPDPGLPPIRLSPEVVQNIHRSGGSILGLGRGLQDTQRALMRLRQLGVNLLFTVGGDGTMRGAHAIAELAASEGPPLAVVGVPKTIDNDIEFVDQTLGFETAVQVAAQALDAAHIEATSVRNGISVVKLMGREAGFFGVHATLASLAVNFCLIPEVPFDLHGPGGLFEALEARVRERGHALIVISEGCGSAFEAPDAGGDVSGSVRLPGRSLDVGPRLCEELLAHFQLREFPVVVKYIDPGTMIRTASANASDNEHCDLLARHAVHAAMAGKSDLVIGRWNGFFTHVPLALCTARKKRVRADSELWLDVTSTTGQARLCRTRSVAEGPREPRDGAEGALQSV